MGHLSVTAKLIIVTLPNLLMTHEHHTKYFFSNIIMASLNDNSLRYYIIIVHADLLQQMLRNEYSSFIDQNQTTVFSFS